MSEIGDYELESEYKQGFADGVDSVEIPPAPDMNDAYNRGFIDGKTSTEDSISLRQMSLDRALKYMQHSWDNNGTVDKVIEISERFRKYVIQGEQGAPTSA